MPACAEKATEKLPWREMFSAMMAEVDLVHLEAAVLLGDVDGGEAEIGGLLDEAAGDGEVLGLDGVRCGRTSLTAKSAVVWAIWRCSSVKSSGKKQSCGVGCVMRKAAAGGGGGGGL